MFEKAIAGKRLDRGPSLPLGWVAASVAGHALLVAGLSLVPLGVRIDPAPVERTTYLVIQNPPAPRALPATPIVPSKPRTTPRAAVRRSEAPLREAARPRAPVEPAVPARPVAGRVAASIPAPASLAIRGLGNVGAVPDSGAAPARESTVESAVAPVVDFKLLAEPPQLVNRREVTRALERTYPRLLKARNVEGEVMATFVIGTDGRVEMDSVGVVWASDPRFVESARNGLARMRFRPAELHGMRVRVRAMIPFRWVLR